MADNDRARDFIRACFTKKRLARQGGVSSAQIFSSRAKKRDAFTIGDLEAALTAMRRDGELGYTLGIWWKREAR